MTVKQFFKSQAFKCIIVLLVIALISGGLLAILNDVLYVSEEERTMRAIEKVYGKEMKYEELEFSAEVQSLSARERQLSRTVNGRRRLQGRHDNRLGRAYFG